MTVVIKIKRSRKEIEAEQKEARRLIPPNALPPGMQGCKARVYFRPASCDEVECEYFLNGWTDPITQKWNAPGTPCGQLHRLPNGVITYHHQVGSEVRKVGVTEHVDRMIEGWDAQKFIIENELDKEGL